MDVRSLERVDPGVEITIPYIDPALPYTVRQDAFRRSYGFTCRCTRCLMESQLHLVSPAQSTPAHLHSLESLFQNAVFLSLPPAGLRLAGAVQLPLTMETIDTFPPHLLPLLGSAYLPSLSEQFSNASHGRAYDMAVMKGVTLLGLYLTIYPRHFPLVGLHALEIAKVAWNAFALLPNPSRLQSERARKLVIDLLRIVRGTLNVFSNDIVDSTGPQDEVELLEGLWATS